MLKYRVWRTRLFCRPILVKAFVGVLLLSAAPLCVFGYTPSSRVEVLRNGSSWSITFTDGPGEISFWWKVSSEQYHDYLKVYLDGELLDGLSGEMDWRQKIVTFGAGSHTVKWAYVKDSSGSVGSDCGWVDAVHRTTLAESLECELAFTTGGSGSIGWFGQSSSKGYAGNVASSGPISHGQSTWMQTTVSGPVELSFDWKVSSAYGDYLSVSVDGHECGKICGVAHSNPSYINWTTKKLQIGPGDHVVKWNYTKDSSGTAGADCGWVDHITVGIPLESALDTTYNVISPGWTYQSWYGQSEVACFGGDSARSCPLDDGGDSWMLMHVEGPYEVVFWWKVSSEKDKDRLLFVVDGIPVKEISGEKDWCEQKYVIESGMHYIGWHYVKDASGSAGEDCGWVDGVGFTVPYFAALDVPSDTDIWSSGKAVWYSCLSSSSHDDKDMMRSGEISDGEQSKLGVTIEGPADVSFWWKVSSEEGYDWLKYMIDGAVCGKVSGSVGWRQVCFTIPLGSHSVEWVYSKDGGDSEGEDCGWLDELVITPVSPIPDMIDPTPQEIREVLSVATDTKLASEITNKTGYAAFREWAGKVKQPDGSSVVGEVGVMTASNAWLSYALDCETIIGTLPKDEDVRVEEFGPAKEDGKFDFTVDVKDVEIGSAAVKENLKRVFGFEGGTSLLPGGLSSDNVDITFGSPVDGKLKFTAGPNAENADAKAFFMKVKVLP